jgi:DNA-directed RNA polymerase subunit RPC12/RpoP
LPNIFFEFVPAEKECVPDASELSPDLCRAFRVTSEDWEEWKVEGYCVKCRAKKEIKDAKQVTMKNGRPATEGACPDCGTKIFKIGKAS